MTEATGDLLYYAFGWTNLPAGAATTYLKGGALPNWADFGTDARAAVPYAIYIPMGSSVGGIAAPAA
jgi:hypothetical protein